MRRRIRIAFVVAAAAALTSGGVFADMAGSPAIPPALDAGQQRLVEENPDLGVLSNTAPWALRSLLRRLGATPRDNGGGHSFDGLDPFDIQVLDRNPALMIVYQASPEAAAELLALIKAAGSGGKKGF